MIGKLDNTGEHHMTIERMLRLDYLGSETQFHVVDNCITAYGREQWEALITKMALGYTKIAAVGDWKGTQEAITVYRVASLTGDQINECVTFLLDAKWSPAIGRLHRDLYVVWPNGQSMGYSYEYGDQTINLDHFHGQVSRDSALIERQSPAAQAKYHGARDTGWR
jgi:hypothetical protein